MGAVVRAVNVEAAVETDLTTKSTKDTKKNRVVETSFADPCLTRGVKTEVFSWH